MDTTNNIPAIKLTEEYHNYTTKKIKVIHPDKLSSIIKPTPDFDEKTGKFLVTKEIMWRKDVDTNLEVLLNADISTLNATAKAMRECLLQHPNRPHEKKRISYTIEITESELDAYGGTLFSSKISTVLTTDLSDEGEAKIRSSMNASVPIVDLQAGSQYSDNDGQNTVYAVLPTQKTDVVFFHVLGMSLRLRNNRLASMPAGLYMNNGTRVLKLANERELITAGIGECEIKAKETYHEAILGIGIEEEDREKVLALGITFNSLRDVLVDQVSSRLDLDQRQVKHNKEMVFMEDKHAQTINHKSEEAALVLENKQREAELSISLKEAESKLKLQQEESKLAFNAVGSVLKILT